MTCLVTWPLTWKITFWVKYSIKRLGVYFVLKTVQVNFVVHFTVLVLCLLRNLLEQSLQDATSKWLRFQCARCFKIFPWKGLWHNAKICDTMTGFVTFCLCTTLNRFQWILPAILCNLTLFCCCCCSQYKFWRFFFPV